MVMTEPLAVLRWASPPPGIQDDHPRGTGQATAAGAAPSRDAEQASRAHPDEEQCDLLGVNEWHGGRCGSFAQLKELCESHQVVLAT